MTANTNSHIMMVKDFFIFYFFFKRRRNWQQTQIAKKNFKTGKQLWPQTQITINVYKNSKIRKKAMTANAKGRTCIIV